MKHLPLITFLLFTFSVTAQSDTLNRFDENKKKHGFWLTYLNERLLETDDTNTACYYGYDYYEHGYHVIHISVGGSYKKTADSIYRDHQLPQAGKPVLLEGNFKFFNAYGDIGQEELYSVGLPVLQVSYNLNKEKIPVKTEILDYTRRYEDQFGSMYFQRYSRKTGKLTECLWFRKENNKWVWNNELKNK